MIDPEVEEAPKVRKRASLISFSRTRKPKADERWQAAFRERDGLTWVYLADEFYLNAALSVPAADEYDDYPQYENGIGLVRSFTDDFEALLPQLKGVIARIDADAAVTLVSGTLFAPVLEALFKPLDDPQVLRVMAVENRFFGGNVAVAGLLTSADIVPALIAAEKSAVYLLPASIVNSDGLLLDDVPAGQLGMRSGRDVRLISCDARGLLQALTDVAAGSPSS